MEGDNEDGHVENQMEVVKAEKNHQDKEMEVADKGQVHVQRQVDEGIQDVDLEEEDKAQCDQDGQSEVHEDEARVHDVVHVDVVDEVHDDVARDAVHVETNVVDEVPEDEIQSDGVDAKV